MPFSQGQKGKNKIHKNYACQVQTLYTWMHVALHLGNSSIYCQFACKCSQYPFAYTDQILPQDHAPLTTAPACQEAALMEKLCGHPPAQSLSRRLQSSGSTNRWIDTVLCPMYSILQYTAHVNKLQYLEEWKTKEKSIEDIWNCKPPYVMLSPEVFVDEINDRKQHCGRPRWVGCCANRWEMSGTDALLGHFIGGNAEAIRNGQWNWKQAHKVRIAIRFCRHLQITTDN